MMIPIKIISEISNLSFWTNSLETKKKHTQTLIILLFDNRNFEWKKNEKKNRKKIKHNKYIILKWGKNVIVCSWHEKNKQK